MHFAYKKVTSNWYNESFVRRPRHQADEERVEVCSCKAGDDCEEDCVNRALYIECPRQCPKGSRCRNQRLSRRQFARTAIAKTADRGHGLFASERISAGSLIIEYCGEVISSEECYARLSRYAEEGISDFYMFQLSRALVIDARLYGNAARFINHSCDANCATQTWTVGAQQRVGVWAIADIAQGEEITYNYNAHTFNARGQGDGVIQHCRCGAANCSRFLGEKPTPGKQRGKTHKGHELREDEETKKNRASRSQKAESRAEKRQGARPSATAGKGRPSSEEGSAKRRSREGDKGEAARKRKSVGLSSPQVRSRGKLRRTVPATLVSRPRSASKSVSAERGRRKDRTSRKQPMPPAQPSVIVPVAASTATVRIRPPPRVRGVPAVVLETSGAEPAPMPTPSDTDSEPPASSPRSRQQPPLLPLESDPLSNGSDTESDTELVAKRRLAPSMPSPVCDVTMGMEEEDSDLMLSSSSASSSPPLRSPVTSPVKPTFLARVRMDMAEQEVTTAAALVANTDQSGVSA